LLTRVQKNRRQPAVGLASMSAMGGAMSGVTPANTTGPAAAAKPAAPQPNAAARARKHTPAEPITAAVAAPPTPVREEAPALEAPRRPAPPSRPISPLENALSGEVEREERAAPAPTAPRAPVAPAMAEPPMRSQRPPAHAPEVAAASAQQPIVPRVIEPDPPRTSTRPIAQVVSKHAPVVDATFGAMLKRSLSLRPH
jgi:translation initiation factor IF-2